MLKEVAKLTAISAYFRISYPHPNYSSSPFNLLKNFSVSSPVKHFISFRSWKTRVIVTTSLPLLSDRLPVDQYKYT
jgi:hypothetical protein